MLRRLLDRFRRRPEADRPPEAPVPRDYARERADQRRAQMSDEDRAWEQASQQRARERRDRDEPPVP